MNTSDNLTRTCLTMICSLYGVWLVAGWLTSWYLGLVLGYYYWTEDTRPAWWRAHTAADGGETLPMIYHLELQTSCRGERREERDKGLCVFLSCCCFLHQHSTFLLLCSGSFLESNSHHLETRGTDSLSPWGLCSPSRPPGYCAASRLARQLTHSCWTPPPLPPLPSCKQASCYCLLKPADPRSKIFNLKVRAEGVGRQQKMVLCPP